MTDFTKKLLEVAVGEVGVRESPLGSNRGARVDEYIRSVGLDPENGSYAWCAAFVYWCFQQTGISLLSSIQTQKVVDVDKLPPRTAGVLDHWNKSKGLKIEAKLAQKWPGIIEPGQCFFIDEGHGLGHMGLVLERFNTGNEFCIQTIEGNTNENGSRNGIGVFKRIRKITEINKGFISYE